MNLGELSTKLLCGLLDGSDIFEAWVEKASPNSWPAALRWKEWCSFPFFNTMDLDLEGLKLILAQVMSFSSPFKVHLLPGTDVVVMARLSIWVLIRGCRTSADLTIVKWSYSYDSFSQDNVSLMFDQLVWYGRCNVSGVPEEKMGQSSRGDAKKLPFYTQQRCCFIKPKGLAMKAAHFLALSLPHLLCRSALQRVISLQFCQWLLLLLCRFLVLPLEGSGHLT